MISRGSVVVLMFIWICVVVTLSSRSICLLGLIKIASSREKKMFVRVNSPVYTHYTSYIMRCASLALSRGCARFLGESAGLLFRDET
jgi:hypothetical protein